MIEANTLWLNGQSKKRYKFVMRPMEEKLPAEPGVLIVTCCEQDEQDGSDYHHKPVLLVVVDDTNCDLAKYAKGIAKHQGNMKGAINQPDAKERDAIYKDLLRYNWPVK